MKVHTNADMNARLDTIRGLIDEAINAIEDNAAHARCNGAPGVARDDERIGSKLEKAGAMIAACKQGE